MSFDNSLKDNKMLRKWCGGTFPWMETSCAMYSLDSKRIVGVLLRCRPSVYTLETRSASLDPSGTNKTCNSNGQSSFEKNPRLCA